MQLPYVSSPPPPPGPTRAKGSSSSLRSHHSISILLLPFLLSLLLSPITASSYSYTPAPHVPTRCDPSCAGHGTCDEVSGTCVCPPWVKGPSCTQPALPSCMDGILPAGNLGCASFLTTCACLEECDREGLSYGFDWRPPCVQVRDYKSLAGLTKAEATRRPLVDFGLLMTYHRGSLGHPGKIQGPAPGTGAGKSGGKFKYLPQFDCENACSGRGMCIVGKDGSPWCSCFHADGGASPRLGPGCSGTALEPLHDCNLQANNCSGAGECVRGFCVCRPGTWGMDCSLTTAPSAVTGASGSKLKSRRTSPGGSGGGPPVVAMVRPEAIVPDFDTYVLLKGQAAIRPGSSVVAPTPPPALRPRIYVYELPPRFTTGMHFAYTLHEDSRSMEHNFHKILLTSQHRTADPEDADFFFVPTWSRRVPLQWQSGMAFHREVFAHIQSAYPYWDRHGGTDHIFVSTSDFGACGTHKEHAKSRLLAAPELASAIWLHHYGLKVLDAGGDHSLGLGPCHVPGQDIIIPANSFIYDASDYMRPTSLGFLTQSPMIRRGGVINTAFWANPANREEYLNTGRGAGRKLKMDKLLFFAGASGLKGTGTHGGSKQYSHGVRQRVFELFENRTDIGVVLSRKRVGSAYGHMLATSRFCLAPTGSGFGIRIMDSVVMGCIPVIISDNIDQPFEDLLPYELFSVRVEERRIPDLLDILLAITPEEEQEMHRQLDCCMARFLWRSVIRERPLPPGPDAFASIMEVLRRRIEGRGHLRLKSCCVLE
eukprot:jgi/Mesvir1/7331/Mv19141-RA.1